MRWAQSELGRFKRGVTERWVSAFAFQYIVSLRSQTGNRTVTQMRHPLLVEGRPNYARQSLASTLSAPRVAATSYCHAGRHANVLYPLFAYPLCKLFLGGGVGRQPRSLQTLSEAISG